MLIKINTKSMRLDEKVNFLIHQFTISAPWTFSVKTLHKKVRGINILVLLAALFGAGEGRQSPTVSYVPV